MKEDRSKFSRDNGPDDSGQLDLGAEEVRDRDGYARQTTQAGAESSLWEAEAIWTKD